jgi:hypothetical protein
VEQEVFDEESKAVEDKFDWLCAADQQWLRRCAIVIYALAAVVLAACLASVGTSSDAGLPLVVTAPPVYITP